MIPFYIETYGCQMNVNDSEVVASILHQCGYQLCERLEHAQVILINTCSIRENAEQRVWGRLDVFKQLKKKNPHLKVAILGCMASRLKDKLLEHPAVDFVVGPDSYRTLPQLLSAGAALPVGASPGASPGASLPAGAPLAPVQTKLSKTETYAHITPLRMDQNHVTTFVSIMRGCNNMCAYCIVPYTRGAERSRDALSIEAEVRQLYQEGYKEVNLLGQNVDSYAWTPQDGSATVTFAQLLERVALISPRLRVRFATSHPKDMNNSVLETMARYPNICAHIHLPVQSGSNAMLQRMNRKYTRETYLERIEAIRRLVPGCTITTDIIAGFCDETLQDHEETLSLMREVGFDGAFMFQYSERPNTYAARHLEDNVPEDEKTRRLNEIIALQNTLSLRSNEACIGQEFEVLAEGVSKRSNDFLFGRTSGNKVCIFPRGDIALGQYVRVKVTSCSAATLKANLL